MENKIKLALAVSALFVCTLAFSQKRGVVIYPSDVSSVGVKEWKKRIKESGIDLIALHAATFNEPLDTLKAFVTGKEGKAFLRMCHRMGVDVEYELHVLQLLLPRDMYESHPEYFRMKKDGTRARQYNMCFTCDEAYEAMRPQIKDLLEWMHPTTHRYLMWTDDVTGAFCSCENCCGYTPSEQALLYENRVLKMIREYDPEATVAHLAYQQTMEAPRKVAPAEGVFLEFAPINRDYTQPVSVQARKVLADNLEVFPASTLHVLEYWLDESMFSKWKRNELVKLPFNAQNCRRDINWYRNLGPASITTFATWLGGRYVEQYGPADDAFKGYGRAFSNGSCSKTLKFSSRQSSMTGFHSLTAPDDATTFTWWCTADSLHFRFKVNENTPVVEDSIASESDIGPEDRVELFFCPAPDMSSEYYCVETDIAGRTMDYRIRYYREFDYDWSFGGFRAVPSRTSDGYGMEYAFSRDYLESLGIGREFWIGVFRADFRPDGSVDWYSLRAAFDDVEPDFHKPDMLLKCTLKD